MLKKSIVAFCGLSMLAMIAACAPEVGSDKWCANLKEKDKGEWTQDETKDYVKHCLLK